MELIKCKKCESCDCSKAGTVNNGTNVDVASVYFYWENPKDTTTENNFISSDFIMKATVSAASHGCWE